MPTPTRRALAWLPIALLAGVVGLHFALVACCSLNPWLGGGFGMFSTVDERHVLAVAVERDAERAIELPEELEDAADRAAALPTGARLRALAEALADDPPPGARAVRVEAWRMRFGPAFERRPQRLGAAEVEVAPGGR